MPKRHRILKGSAVLLVAVATGCATPTPSATAPGADLAPKAGGNLISNNASGLISNNAGGLISNNAGGLISNNAGGLISNNAGGLISNNAGGLISNNAGGLISNNAGGLISNNAGGLTGTVRGPAAGLISNNAGGLISNNAGGLISNNAGGLISNNAGGLISNNAGGLISNNAGGLISNNAGGLISNNAGGYRLKQAEAGDDEELVDLTASVPGARVGVFNERGEMVSYGWSTTDGDGNYVFSRLKASGPLLFVKAVYEKEGQQIILMSTAPAPRKSGLVNVAVTPATTIVAKKFGEMIRLRAVNAATLRPSVANKMATVLAPAMTARAVVAAAIFTNDIASDTFDNIMDEAPAVLSAAIEAVAASAGVSAVVGETPPTELPPLPAAAAPIAAAPEETPNVESGVGPEPAAPPEDGGVVTAPVASGGSTGGGATGGATDTGTGGTSTDSGSGTATPVESAVKATLFTVGQAKSGKRLEVEPNSGNLFAPSEAGLQTATVSGLSAESSFSDASGTVTSVCFSGGQKYTLSGAKITWAGGEVSMEGIDPGWTTDLAIKGNDAYVSSRGQNCIFKVDLTTGATSAFAGTPSFYGGYAEGTGAEAAFNQPSGITITADALYVADTFNRRIRKIDFNGTASTLSGGKFGSKDGSASVASFQTPTDVAADAAGDIYVVDQAGQTVRKVSPNGDTITVAGNKKLGNVDGAGDAGSFYFPTSLAFGKVAGTDCIFVGQNDGKIRLVTGW